VTNEQELDARVPAAGHDADVLEGPRGVQELDRVTQRRHAQRLARLQLHVAGETRQARAGDVEADRSDRLALE
jgi:hypothetical protein